MTFMSYMNVLLNEEYGYSEKESGRLTSLVYIFGLILSAPFGWMVDVYGHRMFLMV